MSGFLYYLPGATPASAIESIERAQLGYAFPCGADGKPAAGVNLVAQGPDGQPGLLCVPAAEAAGGCCGLGLFDPKRQTWRCCGEWWMGWEAVGEAIGEAVGKAVGEAVETVRPVDLQRRELVPGAPVVLGDGREWYVVRALAGTGESTLPGRLRLQPDGQWTASTLPAYRRLTEHAQRLLAAARSEAGAWISDGELIVIVCDILAVNYRVGPHEIDALGLLTTGAGGTLTRIADVFLGIDQTRAILEALADAEKKSEAAATPDGGDSSLFVPASSGSTH